jgi:2-methylcitrate dehydratase PrpD
MTFSSRASPTVPRTVPTQGVGWGKGLLARTSAPRIFTGVALVLAGAVAGLAAGQAMATRSAHQTGACIALNMAAALGYLDAEQQRRVRHALATAINPDVDLFLGSRPSLRERCTAGDGE